MLLDVVLGLWIFRHCGDRCKRVERWGVFGVGQFGSSISDREEDVACCLIPTDLIEREDAKLR